MLLHLFIPDVAIVVIVADEVVVFNILKDQEYWGLYFKTFYGRNLRIFVIS